MTIKVDVTVATVYTNGTVEKVLVYGRQSLKDVKKALKYCFYHDTAFKVVDTEKMKAVEIPVVNDSVSQSVSEYFDIVATVEYDSTDDENNESEVTE